MPPLILQHHLALIHLTFSKGRAGRDSYPHVAPVELGRLWQLDYRRGETVNPSLRCLMVLTSDPAGLRWEMYPSRNAVSGETVRREELVGARFLRRSRSRSHSPHGQRERQCTSSRVTV